MSNFRLWGVGKGLGREWRGGGGVKKHCRLSWLGGKGGEGGRAGEVGRLGWVPLGMWRDPAIDSQRGNCNCVCKLTGNSLSLQLGGGITGRAAGLLSSVNHCRTLRCRETRGKQREGIKRGVAMPLASDHWHQTINIIKCGKLEFRELVMVWRLGY